jgi:restriction system protein
VKGINLSLTPLKDYSMDFTPIYKALLQLWYLIPFFIFIAIIKSAWFKGIMGEFIVNVMARIKLDKGTYHLIKNVTLPTDDGTTQIDHIIVSIYGVFVVETKNIKGWIFGGEHQKMWTQQIFKHKNKFQNPLHQNYKHIKTVQELLELDETQVHSLVVFVGDSQFKTELPDNVTYGMGYTRYILSKNESVLTLEQTQTITQQIESGRLERSFKTNREHVKHVREIIIEKESNKLCPKCGNEMIKREVKKGDNIGKLFWGCSQFPKCRTKANFES